MTCHRNMILIIHSQNLKTFDDNAMHNADDTVYILKYLNRSSQSYIVSNMRKCTNYGRGLNSPETLPSPFLGPFMPSSAALSEG